MKYPLPECSSPDRFSIITIIKDGAVTLTVWQPRPAFFISLRFFVPYQQILGSSSPPGGGSNVSEPIGVRTTTRPLWSSVTSPMIAALSEYFPYLSTASSASAFSLGANTTSLPSHARYSGSSPSMPHTPATAGSTGMSASLIVMPTPLSSAIS